MNDYRVDVEVYNGPLDLLLYLIRRDEVDIYDIPIAHITAQYVRYVELLKTLDPNLASVFIVMLATLMEIKSRAMLPRSEVAEDEEDLEDPRLELVRQLLAYKAFKDAARELGLGAEVHALRHSRQPMGQGYDADREMDLEDVSIWTLMGAFAALLEQTGKGEAYHEVVYDETPLALHAADIADSLQRSGGSQLFESIFAGRSKSELIGLFLALLELVRQRRIRVTQDALFGAITIHLIDATPPEDIAEAFAPSAPGTSQDATVTPEATSPLEDDEGGEDSAGEGTPPPDPYEPRTSVRAD